MANKICAMRVTNGILTRADNLPLSSFGAWIYPDASGASFLWDAPQTDLIFDRSKSAAPALRKKVGKTDFSFGSVGFNVYDLLDHQLGNPSNGGNDSVFSYLKECKSRFIRITYPAYSFTKILTEVFAGAIPDREYFDHDFTPDFITLSDALFVQASANEIGLYLCMFWEPDTTCGLFSEPISALTDPTSKTYSHMRRFTRWVCDRYSGSQALAVVSFFNEPIVTEFYPSSPNTAQSFGDLFSELSDIAHSCDPEIVTTSDCLMPPLQTRSVDQVPVEIALDAYRTLFAGLDAWCFHLYEDRNYVGKTAALGFFGDTANSWGMEYAGPIVGAIASAARADGKLVFVGETGIPSALEADTSTTKRRRCIEISAGIADLTLIWNMQPIDRAAGAQSAWCVDPTPGGVRRETIKSLILPLNSRGQGGRRIEYGIGSQSEITGPDSYFSTLANDPLSHWMVALPAISYGDQAGFSVCAWLKISSMPQDFITLLHIGSGFIVGFSPLEGNYIQIDTPGIAIRCVPRLPIGKFFHVAIVYRVLHGQVHYDTFINGIFMSALKHSAPNVMTGAQAAVIAPEGGAAPSISFQGISIIPMGIDVSDILSVARGTVHPDALMHIKTDGQSVWDASKYAVAIGGYSAAHIALSGR